MVPGTFFSILRRVRLGACDRTAEERRTGGLEEQRIIEEAYVYAFPMIAA
jgi:hypothetical protein